MWNSLLTGTSALHLSSDTCHTETNTHAKCIEERIFQLSTDADQYWLMASNESHAGSHESHQMMSSHSHSRLVRIKCKVLSSPPKQTAGHDFQTLARQHYGTCFKTNNSIIVALIKSCHTQLNSQQ